jgi:hypothetical protein
MGSWRSHCPEKDDKRRTLRQAGIRKRCFPRLAFGRLERPDGTPTATASTFSLTRPARSAGSCGWSSRANVQQRAFRLFRGRSNGAPKAHFQWRQLRELLPPEEQHVM